MRKNNRLNDADQTNDVWSQAALIAAFVLIGLLAGVDLLGDLGEGVTSGHVLIEGLVIVTALTGATGLILGLLRRARALDQALISSNESALRWRQEAQTLLKGLGASIDNQFERWQLSVAEKEVALLLLKGLSHKDIARMRGISEATTRQQAMAVYRKADVAGRNDLAAFFLEDLTLPPHD